jgi:hypothetical protein
MADDVPTGRERVAGRAALPTTGIASAAGETERAVDPEPATSIRDPRVVQILSTEHWSLLSARSLAYNEAFTRGGMFLAFLSMSFVGLALVAQALAASRDFLIVTVVVLAFDFVVGLATYGRILAANYEDYLAVQGMARIRHAYGEIAPVVLHYFTSSVHDDLRGVMVSYGSPPTTAGGGIFYGLMTSAGMIGLILSMIGGVLVLVVALIVGASAPLAFVIGGLAGLALLSGLIALTFRYYSAIQQRLSVLFPTPETDAGQPNVVGS